VQQQGSCLQFSDRLPDREVTESTRLRRISSGMSRRQGGALPPSCRRPSRILEGRCQAVNRECQAVGAGVRQ
jgi:hypothetical protein